MFLLHNPLQPPQVRGPPAPSWGPSLPTAPGRVNVAIGVILGTIPWAGAEGSGVTQLLWDTEVALEKINLDFRDCF